jgi:phage terminase large subunit
MPLTEFCPPKIETLSVEDELIHLKYELSPRQAEAFRALADPNIDEICFGGAKGGGKSVFGCVWMFLKCIEVIKRFDLKPTPEPQVIAFMGRKQSVDFTSTTLRTWKAFISPEVYEIKKQEKLIIIDQTVAIQFGGMDDSDTVKKFNSAEYGYYFVDQAEECTEEDIGLLRGTWRLKINNTPLEYKGLLTANPAICWLKPAFITTPQPRTKYIQSLPTDNPYLPDTYIHNLRKAFSFRPELLKAYLEGSWDDLDNAFTIIPYRDIIENINNEQYDKTYEFRVTVCDPSADGDDETVIYDLYNTKIVNSEIYSHRSTMDTTGRLQANAKKNGSNCICVDMVGIGQGIYDRLCEIFGKDSSMMIYGYDGRVKAANALTYVNHKSESWFRAAQLMHDKKCDIPNDPVLISQLASVQYEYRSNEKLQVVPKDKIKEKLKHSPDRADCYVMGLDALTIAKPVNKRDKYAKHRGDDIDYEEDYNPDTV